MRPFVVRRGGAQTFATAKERDYILRALGTHNGNISRTADALGVERSNLYRKMRAFGIVPRKTEEPETAEP